jgi:hypothetical protein
MKSVKFFLLFVTVIAVNSACSGTQKRDKVDLLTLSVPLYIYPTTINPKTKNSYWDDLILSKSSKTQINAIINPTNGDHGKYRDELFYQGIKNLKKANIKVFGYTYSKYANREDKYIKNSIDFYKKEYEVDNIFFDEVNSSIEALKYYKNLQKYLKKYSKSNEMILNPGVIPNNAIMNDNSMQRVIFEGNYRSFIDIFANSKVPKKSKIYNICLIYNVKKNRMKEVVDLAVLKQCGQIYVTDDAGDNPWDTLPDYWNEEVRYVDKLNSI